MSTYFPDDLVTQAEAARRRGCTRQAISKLIKEGRLKAYEVGGRMFVSETELKDFKKQPPGRKRDGV